MTEMDPAEVQGMGYLCRERLDLTGTEDDKGTEGGVARK